MGAYSELPQPRKLLSQKARAFHAVYSALAASSDIQQVHPGILIDGVCISEYVPRAITNRQNEWSVKRVETHEEVLAATYRASILLNGRMLGRSNGDVSSASLRNLRQ
jgi:hypothetical protein